MALTENQIKKMRKGSTKRRLRTRSGYDYCRKCRAETLHVHMDCIECQPHAHKLHDDPNVPFDATKETCPDCAKVGRIPR